MSDDYYGFCDCQLGGLHPLDPSHPRHGERPLSEKERQDWNWYEFGGQKNATPALTALIQQYARARKRERGQS